MKTLIIDSKGFVGSNVLNYLKKWIFWFFSAKLWRVAKC